MYSDSDSLDDRSPHPHAQQYFLPMLQGGGTAAAAAAAAYAMATGGHQNGSNDLLSPHSSVEGSRKTKPGRKPVDPTIQKVKRKNQNREAQRKFRERKEQYIKELEAKIKSIEEIVRESASDRERLTNVIMQLQSENERLRALHDAKGNHTSFNFQVQPSPATFKQPLRSPAYSASPPRDVNDRGASVLSSPSAAQVQEGWKSPSADHLHTAAENNPVISSLDAVMSTSISTFTENASDEAPSSIVSVSLKDRLGSPTSAASHHRLTALPPIHELFNATHSSSPLSRTQNVGAGVNAVISAANTTFVCKSSNPDNIRVGDPNGIAWGLAASTITSDSVSDPTNYGPYRLPNASDVLNRAPQGWRPCAWPADAKEDSQSVRMHTRVCCDILQTRAASLWQLRGPPPYHPVIDLIPCAEMRDKLIFGQSGLDFELFAADVNACARCIGDPFIATSWRVPPEFWHRYPIMINLATKEYFEVGLEDPRVAKDWAIKGVGCSNPRSDLTFPL